MNDAAACLTTVVQYNAGLRERDDDPKDRQLGEAHRRIGELNMENELLRARLEKPGPLVRRRSR